MQQSKCLILPLLCVALLFGSGCQRKSIPCPKPGKTTKLQGKNAAGLEAGRVDVDKNGLVKKRRGIF